MFCKLKSQPLGCSLISQCKYGIIPFQVSSMKVRFFNKVNGKPFETGLIMRCYNKDNTLAIPSMVKQVRFGLLKNS